MILEYPEAQSQQAASKKLQTRNEKNMEGKNSQD